MAPRLPALREQPIGFAHRGARAHAPENTLPAFELALRLGATGLESDVWLTADRRAILDHDGTVGGRLRRKPIGEINRSDLPEHIPTLSELYHAVGTDFDLSLDLKDGAAAAEVIASARDHGPEGEQRLWLCHDDLSTLESFRPLSSDVQLVHSTRLRHLDEKPEQHAARLQRMGIDAVNFHHSEWSGGLITLYHRFDIFCLGWDAQFERVLLELLDAGIDGVFSDHVDTMTDAINTVYPAA